MYSQVNLKFQVEKNYVNKNRTEQLFEVLP